MTRLDAMHRVKYHPGTQMLATYATDDVINFESLIEMGLKAEDLLGIKPRRMTGQDIKALRESLGLTQVQLAKILRVSTPTIKRAEKSGPKRALIEYIDTALSKGLLRISERKADPEKPS